MKIAINTSCAVAGGAITHLRFLLPELAKCVGDDEIAVIGDAGTRSRIGDGHGLPWIDTDEIGSGLMDRMRFETFELPNLLRAHRFDVLFHPGNFAVFRSPIPQVILIHNLAPFLGEVMAGESWAQMLRLRVLRVLTRISLGVASRTIFISRWGRERVVPHAVDEMRMPIIPFGADHGSAASRTDVLERWSLESNRFVLTVSHLYRYKKLEKLIDAYVDLGERVVDFPLVIVGEHYDRDYARRMEDRARASKARIIFTGGLDGPILQSMMTACRLFIFTSEAENLPITLLEAMAAGCAIVTNRACSMPEVCGDAVVYAEPANQNTYADAMMGLLEDDSRIEELRARARRRADSFTWSNAAERTLNLLREVGEERS